MSSENFRISPGASLELIGSTGNSASSVIDPNVTDEYNNGVLSLYPPGSNALIVQNNTHTGNLHLYQSYGSISFGTEFNNLTIDNGQAYINVCSTNELSIDTFEIINSGTVILSEADNTYSPTIPGTNFGSNVTFLVQRDSSGAISSITISQQTPGFVIGEYTINGSLIGGIDTVDDVVIKVTSLIGNANPSLSVDSLGTLTVKKNISFYNDNIFLGEQSGDQTTSGQGNIFLGTLAGTSNTEGINNICIGKYAGRYITTGFGNVFLGNSAGYYHTGGPGYAFDGNIFIGYAAGSDITSTSTLGKIVIGSGIEGEGFSPFDAPDPTKNFQLAIGLNRGEAYGWWIVGDENFNVGIGTTIPTAKLHVGGDAKISDIRISGTQIIGGGSTLGSIQLIPNETLTGQGQYVNLRPTTNLDQTHIHIEAGNVNNADLYLGDDDRFVKIDHTGPVVIGVPSTATTSNWTAPSGDGPIGYIVIDMDVYPWAQYLTLGDTVTLPDTTVVNIINNSLSSNSMSVYFESNISYSTSDILVFSYTPRTEWKFNPDSSAVFPGNLGIGTANPTSKLTVQNGDIKVGVNTSNGVILTDANGVEWRLIVNIDGTLGTVSV
jgi:hypothetical protein